MKNLRYIVFWGISSLLWGCQSSAENASLDHVDAPVFSEHIAPLIIKNCTPCHRIGGGAPFSLTSYDEVKRKAKTIAKVTSMRIMPPWPADPSYSHFVGEKVLSQSEIDAIGRWVKQGCKEGGNSQNLFENIPHYTSSLGTPDLVVNMDTVKIAAGSHDKFFLSIANVVIPSKKYVKAVEIITSQPKLLHHFNGHLINYDTDKKKGFKPGSLKLEITDNPELKMSSPKSLSLLNDDGSIPNRVHSVVNYLPGVKGVMYPDGIGTFELSPQFTLLGNDVHYGPSSKTVIDSCKVNFFFTNIPPKRGLGELMLGTNGVAKIEPPLVIQPNTISKHSTRFTIPESISILTVNPHLHLLGKSFLAYAIKPNGDTIPLIRIRRWNFKWQYFYTFKKMVVIPRGSTIVAEAIFDNTDANPYNPNRPPKVVSERLDFGGSSMRASDEMFQFIITYLGYQPGDENLSLEP